jgi:hypothetical protein
MKVFVKDCPQCKGTGKTKIGKGPDAGNEVACKVCHRGKIHTAQPPNAPQPLR